MAGVLPGVEMPRRMRARTSDCHRLPPDHSHRHHSSYGSWLEPSTATDATMDGAALRARQRLEEKLGHFRPTSRDRGDDVRGSRAKESQFSRKLLPLGLRGWQSNPSKSKGQLCAVCLEDFGAKPQQEVMNLPCSQKYHSKCLLPWLAAHPNCPSCRTPVSSS
ncbi:probable E3 ubiquitin-protein ligase RHY1A [Diospyros lotus]|uniref:probable E3 ubiquitin-protein ligase RHY1A n=1 Tax=Diospyros lotus TaxID=55363 RepID=UPI002257CE0A|nr:probable E3 ubiquitin-protein ligase RHY1A [Diospyros lotus]